MGWWGGVVGWGGFWPNKLSLLVLIEMRIRIKTPLIYPKFHSVKYRRFHQFQWDFLKFYWFWMNFKMSHWTRWDFKKFLKFSPISLKISKNFRNCHRYQWEFQNFKKSHWYQWKFKKLLEISPISVEISKKFKKFHRYRWKFRFTFLKD